MQGERKMVDGRPKTEDRRNGHRAPTYGDRDDLIERKDFSIALEVHEFLDKTRTGSKLDAILMEMNLRPLSGSNNHLCIHFYKP